MTGHRANYNDSILIPPRVEKAIKLHCTGAAKALLGEGYVPDFYQQAGAEFELVAFAAYRQGVRDERDAQAAR